MKKTEILKFCGNDIYPIHNGMKRGLPEVQAVLESNRIAMNLNPILFYSRQRGINCIPMYIIKEFLKADLIGIEKGLVEYSNIYYKEISVKHNKYGTIKMFIYGKEDTSCSELRINKWGGYGSQYFDLFSDTSLYGTFLILNSFIDVSLYMDYLTPIRHSTNAGHKTIIMFCIGFPLENNGITIDDMVYQELMEQSDSRIDSYMLYGGISQLESSRNFNMPWNKQRYYEASRLHYYYDLLKKEYDEKGF